MAGFKGNKKRFEADFDRPFSKKESKFDKDLRSKPSRFAEKDSPRGRFSDKPEKFERSSRGPSRFTPRVERPEPKFDRKTKSGLEMYRVICDGCGEECEVPFKPTSAKPVYCADCFRDNERDSTSGFDRQERSDKFGAKSSQGAKDYSRDLIEINRKLDKIMKALRLD